MPQKEAETVKEWHEALNAGDSQKLLSLVDSAIKLAGPRGVNSGSDVLIDWMLKTQIKMIPLRNYWKGGIVVSEERVEWHNTETGEPKDSYVIASSFAVKDNKVEKIMRYNNLEEALQKEGLAQSDEVKD